MLLITVTLAKPIPDDAAFRQQLRANPQLLSLSLAALARKITASVCERDPAWMAGEVCMILDPDQDTPIVVVDRPLDITHSLRGLPNVATAATDPLQALGAILLAYEVEEGLEANAKLPPDERLHSLIEHYREQAEANLPAPLRTTADQPVRGDNGKKPEDTYDDLAAVDSTILACELRGTRAVLTNLFDAVTAAVDMDATSEHLGQAVNAAQEHLMASVANDPMFVLADQAMALYRTSKEGDMAAFSTAFVHLINEIRKGRPKPENGQVLIPVSRRSYDRLTFAAGSSSIAQSVEGLLDATVLNRAVPTYHDDRGHGEPHRPALITVGQGITIKLDPKSPEAGREADVYIERRETRWQINVSPNSDDIRVVVNVNDDGSLSVQNAHGFCVLEDVTCAADKGVSYDGVPAKPKS